MNAHPSYFWKPVAITIQMTVKGKPIAVTHVRDGIHNVSLWIPTEKRYSTFSAIRRTGENCWETHSGSFQGNLTEVLEFTIGARRSA